MPAIRRRRRVRVHESERNGELNIVPYLDIIINLTMFVLASFAGFMDLGMRNADIVRAGPPGGAGSVAPADVVYVTVTREGFYLCHSPREVRRVVESAPRPAPDIPLSPGGGLDHAGLSERLRSLEQPGPRPSIVLTAEPETPYQVVVDTMQSARTSTLGPW